VPYLPNLGLDEEDGVALEDRRTVARCWPDESGAGRRLRVGVLALPHLSNFTDFDPLAAEPSVALAFVSRPADLARADVVIVPGSKQTLDDLHWLEREGFAAPLRALADHGRIVIGICGGMQMLGREVSDPDGMEGGGQAQGLGLLGLRTVLGREKVTVRTRAVLHHGELFGQPVATEPIYGYEIHLGTTVYDPETRPLFRLARDGAAGEVDDGAMSPGGRVVGTYLHGLFDSDAFRHAALRALRAAVALDRPRELVPFTAQREGRFDRLADHVRRALDVERIENWLR
jgi:adenosylcobyric acid synthase